MKTPEKTLALLGKLLKERDRINNERCFSPNFDGKEEMFVVSFPSRKKIFARFDTGKHLFYFKSEVDLFNFIVENKDDLIELSSDLFSSEISEEPNK